MGLFLSLGELLLDISIDGVVACKVVYDGFLELPVLIGQSYTEQPNIIVYKSATKLQFLDIRKEMPHPDSGASNESSIKIRLPGILQLHGAASVRS